PPKRFLWTTGEPVLGLTLLAGAKELHRAAEQRSAGGGDPAVPPPVADHRDPREGAAVAKVPGEVAEQTRGGPAAKAAHVQQQQDGGRPALELGGELGLEPPIVGGSEAPGCADANEGGGGGDEREHWGI